MQQENPTLEDVLKLVERLSPDDKRRLIERVAPGVEQVQPADKPMRTRSIRGLWADLGVSLSEDEIDEARREAWANRC